MTPVPFRFPAGDERDGDGAFTLQGANEKKFVKMLPSSLFGQGQDNNR
jgi:hypothetical protein